MLISADFHTPVDPDVSLDHLYSAQSVIGRYINASPLMVMDGVRSRGGNRILLKAECLQPGGSFKIRGALNAIARLSPEQRRRGVVAYSTGNHARAVAMAARLFHATATIVMSPDAASAKIEAVCELGATVVMAAATSAARREMAESLADRKGLALIPPYDHFDVIHGQGTIALELLSAGLPRLTVLFVPIGGGGLIAGIAAGVKQLDPTVTVIGVEPEWEDDAYQSFQTGQRVVLPGPSASIADAVKVQTLGDLTFPRLHRFVDNVEHVPDDAIRQAMHIAHEACRLILEPAGAIALAAALAWRGQPDATLVAIASGSNTERIELPSDVAADQVAD
ncbi:MAG: threonine/serine dehydratase [Rhodopila sp.]